jgi:TolA-binding protein
VSAPLPEPAPTAKPPPQAGPTAQALFERATAARLAGRHAEAAADLQRFLRRFPGDPRAGLAAYELGRIRLGSLHDPRGAADAFGAAVAGGEGPFREDAEAGRVEALSDMGDEAACRRARDAFRARYPASPHANRVARLCGKP